MKQDYYNEISDMQANWNKVWRDKRRWIVVEEGDGTFSVHEHMKDGVAPPIVKPNKREAAARFLQVFGSGVVRPQDFPEEICCGEVTLKSAEIIPLTNQPPADLSAERKAELSKIECIAFNFDSIHSCGVSAADIRFLINGYRKALKGE